MRGEITKWLSEPGRAEMFKRDEHGVYSTDEDTLFEIKFNWF